MTFNSSVSFLSFIQSGDRSRIRTCDYRVSLPGVSSIVEALGYGIYHP
jgi:hypothetical protein